jgi:hypothetical protein
MNKDYLKNLDIMIQGIKDILTKNHSSLSAVDLVFLEKCISDLEKLKKVRKPSDRKSYLSNFVSEILKTYLRIEIVDKIKDMIGDFTN